MAIADNIKRLRLKRDWTQGDSRPCWRYPIYRHAVEDWLGSALDGCRGKLAASCAFVADMVDDGQRELPRGAIFQEVQQPMLPPAEFTRRPPGPRWWTGPDGGCSSIAEPSSRPTSLKWRATAWTGCTRWRAVRYWWTPTAPQNRSIAAVSID